MRSASGAGRSWSSDRSIILRVVDVEGSLLASMSLDEENDEPAPRRLLLLDLAEQVQAAVREKVHAQSWEVFWHISIDG